MGHVIANRVHETATTTGTGALSLLGATSQGQPFSGVCNDQDSFFYAATNRGAHEYELGGGTYNASGDTLGRTTVYGSSNSNNAVNFSAGTKDVILYATAGELVAAAFAIGGSALAVTVATAIGGKNAYAYSAGYVLSSWVNNDAALASDADNQIPTVRAVSGAISVVRNASVYTLAIPFVGGVDTGGGIVSELNPLGANMMLTGWQLSITTISTSANSLELGYGSSATGGYTQLLAAQDVHSATGVFTAAKAALIPTADYITLSTESGASAGLAGVLYLQFVPA